MSEQVTAAVKNVTKDFYRHALDAMLQRRHVLPFGISWSSNAAVFHMIIDVGS